VLVPRVVCIGPSMRDGRGRPDQRKHIGPSGFVPKLKAFLSSRRAPKSQRSRVGAVMRTPKRVVSYDLEGSL
jgi:hypothetical protein